MRIVFVLLAICPVIWGSPLSDLSTPAYVTELPATNEPRLMTKSLTVSAQEDESVVLPCEIDDLGEYVVMWKKEKRVLFINRNMNMVRDNRLNVLSDYSLEIMNITRNDSGRYKCQISTEPSLEVIHTLDVMYPPTASNGFEVVKAGEKVILNCSAQGNPPPMVTWERLDGKPLGQDYQIDNNNLIIEMAEQKHSGVYQCVADNGIGKAAKGSFRLSVQDKPSIEVPDPKAYSGEGASAMLVCEVYARLPTNVMWSHVDGSRIQPSDRFEMKQEPPFYKLFIQNVTAKDFGNYTCSVTNEDGEASAMVELSEKPSPVIFTSSPNGYRPTSYALTWSVTSYLPVEEYMLQFRRKANGDGDEEDWRVESIPAEKQAGAKQKQTYELTGLEEATLYEVVMLAKNAKGWSDPSETFIFSTKGIITPTESVLATSAMQQKPEVTDPIEEPNGDTGSVNYLNLVILLTGVITSTLLSSTFSNFW